MIPENELKRPETKGQAAARGLQRRLRITPLDRLIIDAVVDSRQGVVGALGKQDLNKAVDEFIDLNGRRQQSYFHAGFRDALFDLPFATTLPAQNERRSRWYWAGVVQGLARTDSWGRIVDAYDNNSTVRELGNSADAASRSAGIHIAQALWKTERTPELNTFVHFALARRPDVHQLLLEAATESLRSRSPGVARTLFALLMESEESLNPGNQLAQHAPTVRRRMAHCLRLLGEYQGAEELLLGLLRDNRDPDMHAMVHADLGLLKGSFSLLDEVRIAGDETARQDLVDRLRAGEEHFRDAVENPDAIHACHGHYCMGVLALADDDLGDQRYEAADQHLERAHAQFRGNRNYPPSLVAQTEVYLGVAKLQLYDVGEIHHAARLIASGLNGAAIPSHFIAPTVESLALSEESIESIAGLLLESGGDNVLDALAATAIADTYVPIAERLYERSRQPNRRKALAAADLRAALCGFLGTRNVEKAREVLDQLERLAVEGSGVVEFLEILDSSDRYEPAWEREDAAVASARCLEVEGKYIEALLNLRGVFHSYMHSGDSHDALGVLDRIRGYGLEHAEYSDLERRYEGSRADDEAALQDTDPVPPVTVLVIGGNEIQAKFADRVQSKIAQRDPRTTVEFLHTGWTSNWHKYVEETDRRLAHCDAVVIMRYIRTLLGGHVRALCGKRNVPWRFCWSGGQGGLVESTLAAAHAVRVRG